MTMLNRTTTRNYVRHCATQESRDNNSNLQQIKQRYAAGEITKADYETLTAFYGKEKQRTAKRYKKKLSYKAKP